ncbi:MAG TPA: two-component regulator propeller domain-containing protein [Parafilimonas sp.]|nr:two-component regulator propeller domain-containing protein [Parafilimonas sp.]
MKQFFFTLALTCLALHLFSQQPKQYSFVHFSTSNGLVTNTVNYATQDANGYMWFATIDGLQRYDGNNFLTFRKQSSNPNSLPADNIVQVFTDKKQNLWVWSGTTVGIFNTSTFTFTPVPVENETKKDPFTIVFLGQADNGYAAIYVDKKGIYNYDPVKKMFISKGFFQLPKGWGIADIRSFSDDGKYFFACTGGVAIFDSKTGHLNYRGHNQDNNRYIQLLQNDSSIIKVYFIEGNKLWFGSWPMVAYAPFITSVDAATGERKQFSVTREFDLGYTESRGGLLQRNGRIWFCGRTYVVEFTGTGDKRFNLIQSPAHDEQSIRFDQAQTMYEDKEHNIWICTDNGVYLFNPDAQTFHNYNVSRPGAEGTETPTITASQLNDGRILIGTWGGGLYLYDSSFDPLPLPASLKALSSYYSVWSIHQHSKTGLIWMGMMNGELVVYDPVKNKAQMFRQKIFEGSTIRTIAEDKQGSLWFGSQGGAVIKWDIHLAENNVQQGYRVVKPKGGGYMQKLFADRQGFIWAGSVASGIYKYEPSTNKEVEHLTKEGPLEKQLAANSIADIFQYNDSLLLIATGAVNLYNLKTRTISHFSTEDGLPSNTINSFAVDDKGGFWMGMAHGLCRVKLDKLIFSTYDRRDGIAHDLFNPSGVCKLRDGRLVYTTDKNFLVFDPRAFISAPVPPVPLITDFKLANKRLLVDSLFQLKRISLGYANTSIVIEFNSLNYTKQNKIHYAYKLEGLDKDWQSANELNQAIYNYLMPGNYTFKVRAENNDGSTSAERILKIDVMPPFWQAWWFLGLLALAVIAVFYIVDNERVKKLKALQNVRTQIAHNLHQDVNTTLSNISLLSEMAKIKVDKDTQRSKEYIDQISDKSKKMTDSLSDMLWTLDPSNDNMQKTILRMKETAEAFQSTHNTDIKLAVDDKVKTLKLNMKTRHELFFIFKEALRNISAHANGSPSLVDIDLSGGKLLMKIQNADASVNSASLEFEQSKKDMFKRAKSMKAEFDLLTDKKGVSLVLVVPIA